jgi:Arc/MetJ-type ribon-helix-helix transcriptional regulator
MSELLHIRVSKARKKTIKRMVDEGLFRSISEAVNTALTLLLEKYGKLGVSDSRIPEEQVFDGRVMEEE